MAGRFGPARVLVFTLALARDCRGRDHWRSDHEAERRRPLTDKVILFASDGMRPDLVDKYAGQGAMPTMAELMADGIKGKNGLLQGFRPTPGRLGDARHRSVAGATARPTTPSSTRSRIQHRLDELRGPGDPPGGHHRAVSGACREDRCRWSGLPREAIPGSAGTGGRLSLLLLGSRHPRRLRPTRTARRRERIRCLVPEHRRCRQPGAARRPGIQRPGDRHAGGWTNVPATQGTPKETQFRLRSTSSGNNATRLFDLFIYDTIGSSAGYDHVLVVPSTPARQERRSSRGQPRRGRMEGRQGHVDRARSPEGPVGSI